MDGYEEHSSFSKVFQVQFKAIVNRRLPEYIGPPYTTLFQRCASFGKGALFITNLANVWQTLVMYLFFITTLLTSPQHWPKNGKEPLFTTSSSTFHHNTANVGPTLTKAYFYHKPANVGLIWI